MIYTSNKCGLERAEELLLRCFGKNPFVGEPHVVFWVRRSKGDLRRLRERERERLKEGWPLCWSGGAHEGWIAWARVLVMKAKERSWPQNPWGILNQLGSCEVNMVLLLVSRSASSHMSITCRSNKM